MMKDKKEMKTEAILAEVARRNHTTVEAVRKEIEAAMMAAWNDPNPEVQKQWAAIPSKGERPTLTEFIEYASQKVWLDLR